MSLSSHQLRSEGSAAGAAFAGSPSEQVVQFVNSRINFERLPAERYDLQDFKLERMRELLARMGDPQRAIPAVHIAGTKGKGSTAAMTASVLAAAGYRVGLFTSPHLESIGERMRVNGDEPSEEQLGELMTIVPPVVRNMDALGPTMRPTFFECITALAWEHFRRSEVGLAVLEVGLGGRLDATNVCEPLVTIITSISRDHERLLGSSLSSIAAEKAGIIRPGVPVLSGVTQSEPRNVVRETAATHGAPLFEIDRDLDWSAVAQPAQLSADGPQSPASAMSPLTIRTRSPWGEHRVRVPLRGRHQATNALLALSVCDLLARARFPIAPDAIDRGWSTLDLPLRIEVLCSRPLVVVDAAHNDASIESLIETISTVRCHKRLLVFATSKDKDAAGMLTRLNGHFDEAILTQFVGNPRSIPVDVLRSSAAERLTIPFECAATPSEAWQKALQRTEEEDLICATGSFFLAAEMRAVILAFGDPAINVCGPSAGR